MHVPRKTWIFVGLAAIVAVGVALFEWNMLRHPLADYFSVKVGRPVKIDGDLCSETSLSLTLPGEFVVRVGRQMKRVRIEP